MLPIVLLVGLVLSACHAEGQRPAKPNSPPLHVTDKDYKLPALPQARVIVTDAYGHRHVVKSEVAATPYARTRGLMWRNQLPQNTGMLFVFPRQARHSFWMKNTFIPLDIIFIDERRTVVACFKRLRPRSLRRVGPRVPVKYVLEVSGGLSEAMGFRVGATVIFEGLEKLVVY